MLSNRDSDPIIGFQSICASEYARFSMKGICVFLRNEKHKLMSPAEAFAAGDELAHCPMLKKCLNLKIENPVVQVPTATC